ncbi:MAG: efflux RND transporter periplasmic adaptor subunit [Proteobacteria bacterium]|nr:efflux RND transporter periplasmic adaptor subunit [Pseudomonadota bacterium]
MRFDKKNLLIGLVAVAVVVGGVWAWQHFAGGGDLPEGLIQANGRIEGDHTTVASKLAGRIAVLKVREGDAVQAGQVLAQLEDTQLAARQQQADAAVATVAAQLQAARAQLAIARREVPLAEASADAVLAKARAAEAQAAKDARRFDELAERGTVEPRRAEQMRLAHTASAADLRQAEQSLSSARLGHDKVKARENDVAALEAGLRQAEAAAKEVASLVDDLTLRAPTGGVILTHLREAGEMVAAGTPIFDLVDLDKLYLKVYVPEKQIGQLRLGLPAQVYTDAFPGQTFAATTRYIASQAEFTPKEVQTPDERVKLTYAVKLYFDANPDHRLTSGVPADAVIRWRDGVPWQAPRW